ncbi:hypothetical protein bcgnr5369_26480 [Bacillus cereus]|uniref:Flp family type IVb pilin n=1 Tax=Bacillus thuringiensis TaxID=1428 RepID=A0A9X6WK34_BACTU|nr:MULTISPECIES: Flp family type IVb pilin [Bacillus cereus group]PFJ33985.1 hypothetical protein COJ15_26810 [Bacillus thuringiensis]PGP12759.1 hypothetical protein COA01_33615 [Bacillus cereus]
MKKLFTKFFKEEDGATIVEYVIMLSIVAAIVLFAFPSLRRSIVDWITGAFKNTKTGMDGTTNDYICPDGSQVKDLSTCK